MPEVAGSTMMIAQLPRFRSTVAGMPISSEGAGFIVEISARSPVCRGLAG
ncbi:hypothetical protein [Roseivivax halodurans]|nr:hypothetical protein [Roseivivax halodurans]